MIPQNEIRPLGIRRNGIEPFIHFILLYKRHDIGLAQYCILNVNLTGIFGTTVDSWALFCA